MNNTLEPSNPVCHVCSKIHGFPISHPHPINDGCPNKAVLDATNKDEIIHNRNLTTKIINVLDKLNESKKKEFEKELGELLIKFSK